MRLDYLIQERGIAGVVKLTKKSAATVRNWEAGRTRPSAKIARSVERVGRTEDTLVIKRHSKTTGKFEYLDKDVMTTKTYNRENRARARMGKKAVAQAKTAKSKKAAALKFQPLTFEETEDIDRLMDERDAALAEGFGPNYDSDWWDDWRERLYDAGYGTA
jgi:hypothetical protein